MHYRNLLSLVVVSSLLTCCFAISISSPSSNSDIVAGSTILVSWITTTTSTSSLFDIQLLKYNPDSSSTKIELATDIQSSLNSYLVNIPTNVSTATKYTIAFAQKDVLLAAVSPLRAVLASTTSDSITMKASQTNTTSSTTTPTITMPINYNNQNNNYLLTTSDSNNDTQKDLGPTLTSAQVAGIAMGVIAIAFVVFGIPALVKLIRNRKRASALNVDRYYGDDESSLQSTNLVYSSPFTNNSTRSTAMEKKRMLFLEEKINYGLYYGQHYTDGYAEAGGYYLKPPHRERSPSPIVNITSQDNHPFGQPPQQFDSNKYYVDLPLPPQNAYRSHRHPKSSSSSSKEYHRKYSPTVPPLSPSTDIFDNNNSK